MVYLQCQAIRAEERSLWRNGGRSYLHLPSAPPPLLPPSATSTLHICDISYKVGRNSWQGEVTAEEGLEVLSTCAIRPAPPFPSSSCCSNLESQDLQATCSSSTIWPFTIGHFMSSRGILALPPKNRQTAFCIQKYLPFKPCTLKIFYPGIPSDGFSFREGWK